MGLQLRLARTLVLCAPRNSHRRTDGICRARIIESCESTREEFSAALMRGYEFWRERFFLSNGWSKYYPDRLYPADAHSAAAAIVALVELHGRVTGAIGLAHTIAGWTLENL